MEQKAKEQIRQGKGIGVALREGSGVICGTPAEKLGLHCPIK